MISSAIRRLLLLPLALALGCSETQAPTHDADTAAPAPPAPGVAAPSVNSTASPAETEDDHKTWSLGSTKLSGWASGDNHPGETTYIWGHLANDDGYVDGKISCVVQQPDGTTLDAIVMEKHKIEEGGDPNYGATLTPTQKGRHRVSFTVTPAGASEQQVSGLVFDVE
jgi:hypothetical protein